MLFRTDGQELADFDAELIDPAAIPEPYDGLLVHQRDMTSTLAAYHQEEIALRVLGRSRDGDVLSRHVVLVGAHSGRPVEYGAARIRLNLLSEPARTEAEEGMLPLGAVLNCHKVGFASCPGGFFRLQSNTTINRAFGLECNQQLFGRCNCLSNSDGAPIAEVVEILPPEEDA